MNTHVLQRLAGIQQILTGVHAAGGASSNSTRGRERETFIDSFLSGVFPTPFRFGSGDITDRNNNRSGQIDVVVEYPFLPSLPIVSGSTTRLYLAEGVAAAIEVKSDVSTQWNEVISTARQLQPLDRKFGGGMIMGLPPLNRIPLFAVGYKGWQRQETVRKHLDDSAVDGILVIDPGIFVSKPSVGGVSASGAWALWGLISCLHHTIGSLKATMIDPGAYASP